MKVSAFVHLYPPFHNAGAEHYLHTLLKYLLNRGIDCEVYARDIHQEYAFDGIRVYPRHMKHLIAGSDAVITHLDMTGEAINICRKHKLPLIHIIHNSFRNKYIEAKMRAPVLCLYNSEWIYNDREHDTESMILHPPVDVDRVQTTPGDRITLLNLNENKGGFELGWLAKMFPEYNFLGVKGSYDSAARTGQITKGPGNIEFIDNTPNVKKVYARTKILIMPSKYESYGLTAIEAGLSGIPVLHNETKGLQESLQGSGVSVPLRDGMVTDMDAFGKALRKLMEDQEYYNKKSKQIKKHCTATLERQKQELNAVYEKIVSYKKERTEKPKEGIMKAKAIKSFAARKSNHVYRIDEVFEETAPYIATLEKLGFAKRYDEKEDKPQYKNKQRKPGRPKKHETGNTEK